MKDQLLMFGEMTSMASGNATGLQELQSGLTPSGAPDGLMAAKSGRSRVRASRSQSPAKRPEPRIDDTFGQTCIGSSESENLSFALANRFRLRMASLGSTLFQLTWKARRTPSGRSIYALRARALRTSETGFYSWPTPKVATGQYQYSRGDHEKKVLNLEGAVVLAGWQTPKMPSGGGQESRQTEGGGLRKLEDQVLLSSWATPTKRDHKDGASEGTAPTNALLGRQVWLATWATPRANDAEKRGNVADDPRNGLVTQANLAGWATPCVPNGGRISGSPDLSKHRDGTKAQVGLENQARLTDSGPMPNGSGADLKDQENRGHSGQLNPRHSAWLMGLPPIWDLCAFRAAEATKAAKSSSRSSKKGKRELTASVDLGTE